MADFRVDPALMAKGHTLVVAASSDVNTMLKTLEGDVQGLMRGWQSTGATSFTTAHTSWTAKARTISSALDNLGEKLGVVGKTSHQGDTSVSDTFAKFAQ